MSKQMVPAASDQHPIMIMLRGGLEVSIETLRLAWRMEELGVGLRVDPDDAALLVDRAQLLTDDDIKLLRRHRPELLRLLTYTAPTV